MKFRRLILTAALALFAVPAFAQPGAPYAIAAAKDFSWQVVIGDTGSGRKFTPMGTPGGGVKVASNIVLPSGQSGYGLWVTPSFTTFTSGTTAELYGVLIDTPTITSSGATITTAANLKIGAAPASGTSKYSLWVVGAERHDGSQAFSQGIITASAPYTYAQTWNAGGVSFNGLQVNITETASAAGSHYLDVNGGAGGVTSEFFVAKGGATQQLGASTISATTNQLVLGTTNTTTLNYAAPAAGIVLNGPTIAGSTPMGTMCGASLAAAGTCADTAMAGTFHFAFGTFLLSGNASTVTFAAGKGYTSVTSYNCVANDITTRANPVQAIPASATTVTITNTTGATDLISMICVGF